MKKIYSAPVLQINEIEVQKMMAVSSYEEVADPEGEVLTREDIDWNSWEEEY